MYKQEEKFYEFRKSCINGVLVNNTYAMTTEELMDIINCKVVELREINENCWEIELDECIYDSNLMYIERA